MDKGRKLRADCKIFNVDEAAKLYWNEEWTIRDLSKKYGLSYSSVLMRFQRLGIKVRSHSESMLLGRKRHPEKFDFRGSKNPAWKCGWSIDSKGYITISSMGWKRKHRLVAETILNRQLGFNEVVHHINGCKHDNRPENLQVITRAEHSRMHANQKIKKLEPT